jgi:hypothetical protein
VARARPYEIAIVVTLATVATLAMQRSVGELTIYSGRIEGSREAMHVAILENVPPAGRTWVEIGANGVNIRVLTVYAGELLRRVTGSVRRAYILIDTVTLWIALLLLYAYLRHWFRFETALVGVLYFTLNLPLTYLFHHFHPWDRPSAVVWLVMLLALRAHRRTVLFAVLPLAVAIKYDIVPFGVLYGLTYWPRDRCRAIVTGGLLLVVALGTLTLLYVSFPGGFSPRPPATLFGTNVRTFLYDRIVYPPLLTFTPLVAAAALGWRGAPHDVRVLFAFAALLLALLVFQVHFEEIRALVPMVLMMTPCALFGFERLAQAPAPTAGEKRGWSSPTC